MLNNYCTGQLLADGNTACRNWCDKNPELCSTRLREFCVGDNINKQYCKDALLRIGNADSAVNQWCQTHADDPFCACFTALIDSEKITEPTVKAVLSRPECYVAQCASGSGYKYNNMRQGNSCPPVNVCINKIAVAGNEYANLQNVKQECNQSIGINDPQPSGQQQTSQPTQQPITHTTTDQPKFENDQYNNSGEPLSDLTAKASELLGKKIDFFGEFTVEIILLIFIALLMILGIVAASVDSSDEIKSPIVDFNETSVKFSNP